MLQPLFIVPAASDISATVACMCFNFASPARLRPDMVNTACWRLCCGIANMALLASSVARLLRGFGGGGCVGSIMCMGAMLQCHSLRRVCTAACTALHCLSLLLRGNAASGLQCCITGSDLNQSASGEATRG